MFCAHSFVQSPIYLFLQYHLILQSLVSHCLASNNHLKAFRSLLCAYSSVYFVWVMFWLYFYCGFHNLCHVFCTTVSEYSYYDSIEYLECNMRREIFVNMWNAYFLDVCFFFTFLSYRSFNLMMFSFLLAFFRCVVCM